MDSEYKMEELKKTIRIKKQQERISVIFELLPNFQNFFIRLFVKMMKGLWFQYYFVIATLFDNNKKNKKHISPEKIFDEKYLLKGIRF